MNRPGESRPTPRSSEAIVQDSRPQSRSGKCAGLHALLERAVGKLGAAIEQPKTEYIEEVRSEFKERLEALRNGCVGAE